MAYKPYQPVEGTRVIVLSNDPGCPLVGTLVGFDYITQSKTPVPLIQPDDGSDAFITLGALLPYSDDMLKMVTSVETPKPWFLFRDARWFRSSLDRRIEELRPVKEETRVVHEPLDASAKPVEKDGNWFLDAFEHPRFGQGYLAGATSVGVVVLTLFLLFG